MPETTVVRGSSERAANTDRVLRAIGFDGAPTQAQLREATGLSRPTLTAILGELVADGWVRSRPGTNPGRTGRPARTFTVDAGVLLVAGVDVGVHTARAVVADAAGTVRASHEADLPPGCPGEERLARVQRVIGQAAARAAADVEDLAALCVGVPGIVDGTGRIRRSTVVPDWSGFHVGRALEQWTGKPVDVVNDANLAAVGEHWAGAARMAQDVVYLHVGRRTSAGLLIDGKVHAGRTGGAGEIGSIPALFFDTPTVLLGDGASQLDPRIPEVFATAAAGDRSARRRVEAFARHLALDVETLVHVIDPDVVVLGGGVSRAGEALLDAVRRHVPTDDVAPPLALGELADAAVTLGGVRRALLLAARSAPRLRPLLTTTRTAPAARAAAGPTTATEGIA
ncbi:ROK family transcriptional regulator [Georgenia alba]|uniref:ROK family transcriptional regulator n=1 Tax=Georgenia alba TaxID=2233858 RepID=A0ABW2Q446_9MICO